MRKPSGQTLWSRRRAGLTIAAVLAVLLVATVMVAPASKTAAATASNTGEGIGSRAGDPESRVAVIVQTTSPGLSPDVEAAVRRMGGRITRELGIISGFAANVPATAIQDIVEYPGVRWVSRDSEMVKTDATAEFTTWATAIGTSLPNCFTNSTAAVDSPLGPNRTFAAASNKTCALAGFTAEVTPGNAITKVEVALRAYVPAPLGWGQGPGHVGVRRWDRGPVGDREPPCLRRSDRGAGRGPDIC